MSLPAAQVRGSKETLLIIEDPPCSRNMAHLILRNYGYNILRSRSSGENHPGLAATPRNKNDLVLTQHGNVTKGFWGVNTDLDSLLATNLNIELISRHQHGRRDSPLSVKAGKASSKHPIHTCHLRHSRLLNK